MLVKLRVREKMYNNIDKLVEKYTDKFKYCDYEETYIFKIKDIFIYHFLSDLYKFVNDRNNQLDTPYFEPIEFIISLKWSILDIVVYDFYRE